MVGLSSSACADTDRHAQSIQHHFTKNNAGTSKYREPGHGKCSLATAPILAERDGKSPQRILLDQLPLYWEPVSIIPSAELDPSLVQAALGTERPHLINEWGKSSLRKCKVKSVTADQKYAVSALACRKPEQCVQMVEATCNVPCPGKLAASCQGNHRPTAATMCICLPGLPHEGTTLALRGCATQGLCFSLHTLT